MPNKDELINTFGNTTGTYATTAATYGTMNIPFTSTEGMKEYLDKYEKTKAKWLEYCYGEWPEKLEFRAVIPPETGRYIMGMRPSMVVYDELVDEEDEGAWTTP